MNKEIFTMINELAGQSKLTDTIIVFCAQYLIFVLFAVAIGLLTLLAYKHQWRSIIFFCANLLLTFILLLVVSKLYVSTRPFVDDGTVTMLIEHAANQSFPSDHMTAAMGVALSLAFFTRFKFIGLVAVVVACIIGFSRIVAGVHYPLDILGGMGIAVIASILVGIVHYATSRKESSIRFDSHN